jgi:GH15 family glucan-1,4-alpha-glucosidase
MARPIVLSNGNLHVGINSFGLVHDFYYPYVGLENHAAGADLRHKIGVFVDGSISWLDEDNGWTFRFRYPHSALIGHTLARHDNLGIILEFDDFVDTELNIFVRNTHVVNLKDSERSIKVFYHQAFAIGDSRSNTDTAQYLPDSNAILHYRGRRAFIISGESNGETFSQFSIGLFGIEGHEGSFRDAEDGALSGNAVEHGRVDSVIGFDVNVDAHSSQRINYWISAGVTTRDALDGHRRIQDEGIHKHLIKTASWWHQWLQPTVTVADSLPKKHRQAFTHSVMLLKSQIDNRGAVIASTDSSMLNYSRDAYAYCWPRDAGFVLWPLIRLGYTNEAYRFFEFAERNMHPSGYLMHKYRADGAIGSSWHPYKHGDDIAPPIQEDETAMTVFMLSQYYHLHDDKQILKRFYKSLVKPMADFLVDYVDPSTGLTKPSYDLWEERFMVTTYTTSITYAALLAAAELAAIQGDQANNVKWQTAAEDIQAAAHKHLYNQDRQVFLKGIYTDNGRYDTDPTIDSSAVFGAYLFGLFDSDSHEVASSIETLQDTFSFSVEQPGLPRYENDPYRREGSDVTGNWWYISTLWHAQYLLDQGDITTASSIIDWVTAHASSSDALGEQINPKTDTQIAPMPLTWSHAELVSTLLDMRDRKAAK